MRGKLLHNFIAAHVQMIAELVVGFAVLEYLFRKDGVTTFFDVFACRDSFVLAFEIETTSRHAIDNAMKATRVGVPMWIVVPTRRLRTKLTSQLDPLGLRPGGEPIKILTLGEIEQELRIYLSIFITANRQHNRE